MSALKWQGWLVALVFVAGLLVFAPLGLYVWAGGAPAARPAGAARGDVRITGCRIDPASRRVVASVEAVNGYPERGAYVVTVEFREPSAPTRPGAPPRSGAPAARGPQALVRVPGVRPAAVEHAEALGPVWPPATIPWCGIAAAEFAPDPPFARSLGLGPGPHASNAGEAGSSSPSGG
ncbi:hypothetical protein OHA37_13890 [Streptomyces sp. NBC_00335]|uniref:hypothetical protein n=1 Tax=unclassified Streptomyces TaxID=2593676 RepID=UPI0022561D58|nr:MULTISPECIES: hypothetical protein [unclassified Streptomyces]MCX5404972.1 hypothetical protein [Streptomyces sp. NBC_00086]